MPMKVLSDKRPKDVFIKASDILKDAVKHTLGPKGSNTAVCTSSDGIYQIINDGKSIVQDLTVDDPAVAPALEVLKQSCFETNRNAGDGTTSTILMTNALLHAAYEKMEDDKINPIEMREILLNAKDMLINKVDEIKKEIKEDDYENVATVALGGNKYADMIANAYKFVGPDGTVAFVREDRKDVILECVDGVTLDKSEFKIIPMKEPKEFFDCKVVFIYEKIDRFAEMIKLLNKSTEFKGKKTLLFYNELSWDASSNIYANIGDGRIDVIPIRMGGYGTATRDVMEQLATYCDCKLIDGINVKLSMLDNFDEIYGNVLKSLVSEDKVVLCTDKEIKENKNYVLQLNNKSCIIKIGGNNKVEREETFRRIEDAVSSLGTAIKDGIVIGGGLAYIEAFESIRSNNESNYNFIASLGDIINKTINYNSKGKYENSYDEGIDAIDIMDVFDSSMVIKEVIKNSFSLVAQIITTNKLIHEMIR